MSTRQQYLSSLGILTIFLRLFQITISEVTSDSDGSRQFKPFNSRKTSKNISAAALSAVQTSVGSTLPTQSEKKRGVGAT